MKNKNHLNPVSLALTVLMAGLFFFLVSCAGGGGSRVEVRIETKNPSAVDFAAYDSVLYRDLVLVAIPGDYNPDEELKRFFLDEFGKAVGHQIGHWDSDAHGELTEADNALLISGKLKIDVKERSRIKEVKGKKGKKGKTKKEFVSVQHWTMTLEVVMKKAGSGTDVYKDEFMARLPNAEPDNAKFNFENLFFKLTNRLVGKVKKTRKMQRRYLLLQR